MLTEQIAERLTGHEDQFESELELFRTLPNKYPEGKMALFVDHSDGAKYTVIRLNKRWHKMALAEV